MILICFNNLLNATRCKNNLYSEMDTFSPKAMKSVKKPSTWGQFAGARSPSETQRSAVSTKAKLPKNLNFEEWLVGFTDGNGTFSFSQSGDQKWSFTYQISQHHCNAKLLYFIKSKIGVGTVNQKAGKDMITYRVRDSKHLVSHVLPIFDRYALRTFKYHKYAIFKEALLIFIDSTLAKEKRHEKILKLKEAYKAILESSTSFVWNDITLSTLTKSIASKLISKAWIVGFTEAKGSFYIVLKDKTKNRLTHSFEITQKNDSIVLKAISLILSARFCKKKTYFTVIAVNLKSIELVSEYYCNSLKGSKSQEFKVWASSFRKRFRGYEYLLKTREHLRKLRK
uniref:ORF339 n=1 Tax=Kryptoperidinium foliaceum endosymbiont TaxID=1079369 RepID=I6N5Q7_9STRA|nr:ORF339 [Kryptoperidinium foliaceum endosymbiont]